jgi:hypothetical protein
MSFDFDAVWQNKIAAPIAAGQEPIKGSTDQTAATKASSVTVESQGDAASSQPTVALNIKPSEAKPPEMLSEKGKPLAARPRGSDHRRERVARKEMVGTTENGLSASPAPRPQGWGFGLP